jgi:putative ABC transport system substrate-binding protein
MRRREFMTLLGGVAAGWPLTARAQQPARPVIGCLGGLAPENAPIRFTGLRQGLKEAGFVEGQNMTVEYRPTGDRYDRFREFAADLVGRRVDAIFASDGAAAVAAKTATATIPIVFAIGFDPVALRLVTSLMRPDRNVTGVSYRSRTVMAKQLELLHDTAPNASVVAAVVNPVNANAATDADELQRTADKLGLHLLVLNAGKESQIADVTSALVQRHADALIVEDDAFLCGWQNQLIERAASHGIPAICSPSEGTATGALATLGPSVASAFHLAGVYLGRILKGEKPADLAVQSSIKPELVINLKTAKALDLTIAPTLLARADTVIE